MTWLGFFETSFRLFFVPVWSMSVEPNEKRERERWNLRRFTTTLGLTVVFYEGTLKNMKREEKNVFNMHTDCHQLGDDEQHSLCLFTQKTETKLAPKHSKNLLEFSDNSVNRRTSRFDFARCWWGSMLYRFLKACYYVLLCCAAEAIGSLHRCTHEKAEWKKSEEELSIISSHLSLFGWLLSYSFLCVQHSFALHWSRTFADGIEFQMWN